jgi:hypothetical protein
MQTAREHHTIDPNGDAAARHRNCSYLQQDCSLTLREGLREYYAANPTLVDPEQASDEGAKFFRRHDACHVIFGTTTGLVDEALTDAWTLLGSDVTLKQYAEFAKLNEAREVLQEIGVSGFAKASLFGLPHVPTVWRRARRMQKKWPWAGVDALLERPLAELRREFGIAVYRAER